MQAGAKGHARVKFNHYLVVFGCVVAPRWANEQAPANVGYMIVIFPGIGPVLFVDNASLQFAYKLRSQAGEMPQALGYMLAYLLLFAINR